MTRNLLLASLLIVTATPTLAEGWEVMPFFGQRFGDDAEADDGGTDYEMTDDSSYGFTLAWDKGKNGRGQILISHASHELERDGSAVADSDLDITYLHFGGVALYPEGNTVGTVGLGFGATHMRPDSSEFSSETYFSGHLSLGARYIFSDSFAFEATLRGYATFINSDSDVLCSDNRCLVRFDSTMLYEADVTAGIIYRF